METIRTRLERKIGGIVALLLLVACLLVLRPFVSALLWAVVLCFSSWPLYGRLLRLVRGRRTLAALLMTLAMILVVLLPFVIIGAVSDDIRDLTLAVQQWTDTGPPPPPSWLGKVPLVGERAVAYWQSLTTDTATLLHEARRLIVPASSLLVRVGKLLVSGLLELALSILLAFFLFRNGESRSEEHTSELQ